MSWFVMIRDQQGNPHPMITYDDDTDTLSVLLFETEEEAFYEATRNMMGRACGYEVYEWQEKP